MQYGSDNLLVYTYDFGPGLYNVTTASLIDPVTLVVPSMTNAALQITGDEAHDAADAGNPLKIGGKVTSGVEAGAVSATSGRTDAWFDMRGRQVVASQKWPLTTANLSNINATYANTVGSLFTSEAINCRPYEKFNLFTTIAKSGTVTDILYKVQFSSDSGTTWATYQNDFFGDLRWSNAQLGIAGLNECMAGDCIGEDIRVQILRAISTGSFYIGSTRLGFK